MLVTPIRTSLFIEGDDLAAFVANHVKTLPEKSVLIVTSKIVSLSEGRTVAISSKEDRAAWVKKESDLAIKTPYAWMTLRDGMVMSSAGVDESNGNGRLILLPKDCFASAHKLWESLRSHYGIKQLGVIISDSRTLPLRKGSVGVCMGFAGLKPLNHFVGSPDLFGREWNLSIANVVDALASAGVHTMGETNQQQPLVLITDATVEFVETKARHEDVEVPPGDDMYVPLYVAIEKKYSGAASDDQQDDEQSQQHT